MVLQPVGRCVTTVDLNESTWRKLNALKQPGDSFDDVIVRLYEQSETAQTAHE